jgi:hypothetical protein
VRGCGKVPKKFIGGIMKIFKRLQHFKVASKKLENLIALNCTKNTVHLTLTFPLVTTESESVASFRAFRKRFREYALSAYVYVIEQHPQGHGSHIHCIFFDVPFVSKEKITESWGGYNWIRRVQLKDVQKLAAYLTKYFSPDISCNRYYYCSPCLVRDSFDYAVSIFGKELVKKVEHPVCFIPYYGRGFSKRCLTD